MPLLPGSQPLGLLHLVQALQHRQIDETSARTHLSSYMESVAQAQVRSEELCQHALTDEGMQQLRTTLSDAGFRDLHVSTVHHDGMLMGWTLQAGRG